MTKYQKRTFSGLLLDRIDIRIEVPRVDYEKLSSNKVGETSKLIRQRVQFATDIVSNTDMLIGEVRQFSQLQPEGQSLKRAVVGRLNLSARAYHRILKVSRTIADFSGE